MDVFHVFILNRKIASYLDPIFSRSLIKPTVCGRLWFHFVRHRLMVMHVHHGIEIEAFELVCD